MTNKNTNYLRGFSRRGGTSSIRKLAKDLLISVITTKRAYEELEKEGFIDTVGGKGTFVAMQNKDISKLYSVIDVLLSGKKLKQSYKDHSLTGELKGMQDCRIEQDWILIYELTQIIH